uniref:Coiled-coil domain-containing protein 138-like isoform X1 n=1 Tax=Saccoglossus kowalevskii TaxID=10224 RepID=A0ABM0H0C0_SACKO|nr:PREDICTED: coiled-coil domain-containing protein 138-like isoform X1 [Saccoglossus kowalevskii]
MYGSSGDESETASRGLYSLGTTKHSSLETATLDLPTATRSIQLSDTPKSSPSRVSTISPSEDLNNEERKHYNRALKELYKIVQLSSKKLEISEHQLKKRLKSLKTTELDLSGDIEDTLVDNEDDSETMQYESDIQLTGISPRLIEMYGSKHRRRKIEDDFSDDHSGRLKRNNIDRDEPKVPVQEIHAELMNIHKKLQRESAVLRERELQLDEREQALEELEQSSKTEQALMLKNAQQEVNRRWMILEEEHKAEIEHMEEVLKNKIRESKRVTSNFDIVKKSNDSLRKQVADLQEQNKKLESQASSANSRLLNLQRKHEFSDRNRDIENIPLVKPRKQDKDTLSDSGKSTTGKQPKYPNAAYDVLAILLEWVSEVHLRRVSTDLTKSLDALPADIAVTQERCLKILPPLVEILHCLPASHTKIHLPCLQYIYWSILSLEHVQGTQKTAMSSTYRHLGEELYKPTLVKFVEVERSPGGSVKTVTQPEKSKTGLFFNSSILHIRLLSSLIILKTLTQVDYLAHVFDVLKNDLKNDTTKELFTHYQGTAVILPYMKGTNKALVGNVVDSFLQMSMESVILPQFLESCSTEIWFRTCSLLLKTPNLNIKMLEKLSIILQKLSKLKVNKRYFEVYSLNNIIQEMQRTIGPDNPFLSLNLKSILFNLGMAKTLTSVS